MFIIKRTVKQRENDEIVDIHATKVKTKKI